ncbi:polysaccharide biosynthesis tyrosine autokinase [Duganella sp. FT134W]|uniref:Polysaccharide biosynthesis tyrosine autokinase n=1 Tax=Duganella margarita TaxID=2692170 RepID=A0A7X4KK50_9BURK|nr:polysaccharide biosynthesis tyrosine autokinase [Duganella margarita]MYM76012.1 polysaccharide biosynthesis tyrosine autokinase [Duganella margarita]
MNQPRHHVPPRLSSATPLLQTAAPLPQYEEEIELASYLDILRQQRWRIGLIVLICTLAGAVYALLAAPVYEVSMLIHVEEDQPNNNAKNMIGEISAMFDVKAAAISEMELLKSRMVIAKSVDNLGLYIDAAPRYFPLIGRPLARLGGALSTPGLFGYGGYAWGTEAIGVAEFYVPEPLQNQVFALTADGRGGYRLQQPAHRIDVAGRIGQLLTLALPEGRLLLRVQQLDGARGAQFTLRYLPKLAAIEQVQKALNVAEVGKQSGLISVTMSGADPRATYAILSAIGDEYVRQNVTRKLEEAEKSLQFLERRLPDIKSQLDQSEADYYRFRHQSGTVDLPEEGRISLQQLAALAARRLELQQKQDDLLANYTAAHPLVQAVARQLATVDRELAQGRAHIRQLPMLEQELLQRSREVKVNTELYSALLNSAQQLRLVKAGKVSNVRLIDPPMLPDRPARPNRAAIIGLAGGGGLVLALLAVALRQLLNNGIRSPRQIERLLGARVVYANVPHSDAQDRLRRAALRHSDALPLLAASAPGDAAIDSLRGLRATLQVTLARSRNNIVQLCGATPGLGKSFLCANFAAVLASGGRRVLLIDADLRAGQLHRYFALPPGAGLSEAIAGRQTLATAIRATAVPGLDLLSTGDLPPNPSEFLLQPSLAELLISAAARYDCVLINAPPLLTVADALVLGGHAGAVFLVARAGVSTDEDLNESVNRLHQAGVAPLGVIFNDVPLRRRLPTRPPALPLLPYQP